MGEILDLAGGIALVIGASFALLAGIGVHRFRDPYSRMHAAAKSPTLGLVLVTIGAALRIRTFSAIATLTLVAILQLLTSPVGTHLVARALHLRVHAVLWHVDELDRDQIA